VQCLADFYLKHIHLNIFRQVAGKARDLDLVQSLPNAATAELNTDTPVFIDEVQRHFHRDLLLFVDAQKVGMYDERLCRMTLERFDHGLFFFLPDIHSDDLGEKGFVFGCVQNVVMVNGQRHWVLIATVNNSWDSVVQTT